VDVEEQVEMARLTTLEVGGPARYLARCRSLHDVREALAFARDARLEVFVFGGGSNLLVADTGFDGLVLQVVDAELVFEELGEDLSGAVRVRAGAGVEWDALVAAAVERGLGGLECLSGIPGRVGAAPIQNVGAYGQEVAETLESVEAVELATGELHHVPAAECAFAYRRSRFKGEWRGRFAIAAVTFRLERRGESPVRYGELARRLGLGDPAAPKAPIADLRRQVLALRRGKSMVLEPGDPNRRSAGSFFLNPVVSRERAEAVRRAAGEKKGTPMPAYPAPNDGVKLAAGWLIERAGFRRGENRGRAAISSRHALALVNRGGATAAEIVRFAAEIRRRVRERFGVTLECEPTFLGFEGDPLDSGLDSAS